MYNLSKKEGFTLLEVLIAVAVSSVIIVGLMTAFWRGTMAWERVEGLTGLTSDVEFMDTILSTDLENAVELPDKDKIIKFSDDQKKITFFSLKRLKEEKVPHIYKVSYKLVKGEKNSNLYNLKRASQKINSSKDLDYKTIIDNLYGENIKFQEDGTLVKLFNEQEKVDGKNIKELRVNTGKKENVVFTPKVVYVFNKL